MVSWSFTFTWLSPMDSLGAGAPGDPGITDEALEQPGQVGKKRGDLLGGRAPAGHRQGGNSNRVDAQRDGDGNEQRSHVG